jgi:hypothetical protein
MATPWWRRDLDIDMPAELEAGVYANVLTAWHTPHEFTLDFGTIVDFEPDEIRLRGVARVKVPPSAVFDVIRIIHREMTAYEATFGPIHYPRLEENG